MCWLFHLYEQVVGDRVNEHVSQQVQFTQEAHTDLVGLENVQVNVFAVEVLNAVVLDRFGVRVKTFHQQRNDFVVTMEDQVLVSETHNVFTVSQLHPLTDRTATERGGF
ncbi:hypothetical protein D3C71_1249480 [compost metagenome]